MSGEREPLRRERVIQQAVTMADAGGLASLSMRKVAAELGFEVMSLYNHVANKDDLLRGMIDLVTAEVELPDAAGLGWKGAMRAHAIASKQMFERHPWAVGLWAVTLPGPHRLAAMEWQLGTLADSDLSERAAHDAFHAIGNHVVGYMMFNLAVDFESPDTSVRVAEFIDALDPERHPHSIDHIAQHQAGDTGPSFELVLDLILDGLDAS